MLLEGVTAGCIGVGEVKSTCTGGEHGYGGILGSSDLEFICTATEAGIEHLPRNTSHWELQHFAISCSGSDYYGFVGFVPPRLSADSVAFVLAVRGFRSDDSAHTHLLTMRSLYDSDPLTDCL